MASRAACAAKPITTDAERAILRSELVKHRRRGPPQKRVPDCLRWLQRQALILDPDADKPEFLSLIQDAIEKFSEVA
jgi:hypothetical protein